MGEKTESQPVKEPTGRLVPGEGFEPSVEDPKSSALPLGHPGKGRYRVCRTPDVTSSDRAAFLTSVKPVLIALLMVTAACGAYQFPSGASSGTGNVSGLVVAVPCSPVEPVNERPCGGRPVAGLEIDFNGNGTTLSTLTGPKGSYTVDLPAGTWKVTLKTYMRIISGPPSVTVTSGSKVVADYILDSGLRVPAQ